MEVSTVIVWVKHHAAKQWLSALWRNLQPPSEALSGQFAVSVHHNSTLAVGSSKS
jgi:hypothetical protein